MEVTASFVRGRTTQGDTGQVRWDELGIVSVLRPRDERGGAGDSLLLLASRDVGTVVEVPLAEASEVLARVRQLPGFDESRFAEAAAGRGERHVIVWSNGWAAAREGGEN